MDTSLHVLRLTHAISSLIGVCFLSYIWYCYYYRLQSRESISRMDLGLPLLAAAYFFWSVLSFYQYVYCMPNCDTCPSCSEEQIKIVRLLSCLNNALFLASFSYFKHGFEIIAKLGTRNRWILIVLAVSLPIGVFFLFASPQASQMVDLLFSSGTLLFMGLLLALAFHNRGLSGLSVLAFLVVTLEIIAQVLVALSKLKPDIISNDDVKIWAYSIYLIAHSMLLANFIALAFTWIIEDEGVLEKFDLHQKIRDLLSSDLHHKDNSAAFFDLLYRLISEHADLDAVCLYLIQYFEKIGNEDGTSEIRQTQFTLNNAQRAFHNGTIDSKDLTLQRSKVSESLIKTMDKLRKE